MLCSYYSMTAAALIAAAISFMESSQAYVTRQERQRRVLLLKQATSGHEEETTMKIRQLIHLLEAQDPEADIAVLIYHDGDTTEVFDVQEVSDNDGDVYIEVYQEAW